MDEIGTYVEATEVAGVEHEYFRYFTARADRRRPGSAGAGARCQRRRGRGVVVSAGDVAEEGRGAGDGDARLGAERRRRCWRADGAVGHRRLVEHADESHGDAHALRAHAQKAYEAEKRHGEPARKPETRHCTPTVVRTAIIIIIIIIIIAMKNL